MGKRHRGKRPVALLIFYALVLYIFFQFCWWAYLLMDLNMELIDIRNELAMLKSGEDAVYDREKLMRNKLLMILGEGSVFLVLLYIGFRQVKKSFMREFAAAKQQKNFLLSITHELNSPLASIKLYLQTLFKRQPEPDKQKEIIEKAIREVDRQSKMVSNILTAAKLDDSTYHFYPERIEIGEFISELIDKIPQFAGTVKRKTAKDKLFVKVDPSALESICVNLLENAVKYGGERLQVTIAVFRDKKRAVIEVADNGEGIPEGEKDKIFAKFYRAGDESTRKTKGSGLGLYLVKYFTESMGGRVSIRDNKPSGAVFRVAFPTAE